MESSADWKMEQKAYARMDRKKNEWNEKKIIPIGYRSVKGRVKLKRDGIEECA